MNRRHQPISEDYFEGKGSWTRGRKLCKSQAPLLIVYVPSPTKGPTVKTREATVPCNLPAAGRDYKLHFHASGQSQPRGVVGRMKDTYPCNALCTESGRATGQPGLATVFITGFAPSKLRGLPFQTTSGGMKSENSSANPLLSLH